MGVVVPERLHPAAAASKLQRAKTSRALAVAKNMATEIGALKGMKKT
jgi:hypothetical protein